jgi:D-xylose transport system substrate-binding protein
VGTTTRRAAVIAVMTVLGSSGLVACGANDADSGSGDSDSSSGGKIALLLPESKATRYESSDKPLFEAKVADLCPDCEVLYFNADQDPAKQQQQVETAISDGADVIVLDPVDAEAAAGLVTTAQDEDIPVIAYDRFIDGADYHLSYDNAQVGKLQATELVDAMGGKGSIVMLNGAPTDPNAAMFKEGAHEVIDASDIEVLAEYDNPDWSPENAQDFMTTQLGKSYADDITGVYAANDAQAGGVFASYPDDLDLADLPPITGQDAELAAIQRIAAGEQYMTIYKSYKQEAEKTAEVAVMLVNGDEVTDTEDFQGTPSFIFDPVTVTTDNIMDTVVADDFYTVEDICTPDYADACAAAGIE